MKISYVARAKRNSYRNCFFLKISLFLVTMQHNTRRYSRVLLMGYKVREVGVSIVRFPLTVPLISRLYVAIITRFFSTLRLDDL